MSSKNRKEIRTRMNTVEHKRMYKAKSHWNVATTGAIALGAVAGVAGMQQIANADTATVQQPATVSTGIGTQSAVTQNTQPVSASTSTNTVATGFSSVVNSANSAVVSAHSTYQPIIKSVGGTFTQQSGASSVVPQSRTQQVATSVESDVQRQVNNIQAVGSIDNGINSAVNSASYVTSQVGGYLTRQLAIDASSMTPSSIASIGGQTIQHISEVGSADTDMSNVVRDNSALVSQAGGSLYPASAIDVSSFNSSQIASMTKKMKDMVSATGSADSAVTSASVAHTSDINAVGGQLKRSDVINTASGYTPIKVDQSVRSQIANISNVASADRELKSAVGSALPVVNANSGVMKPGSVIDASDLTPEQIQSMVAAQSAMVSATAQGNMEIKSACDQNESSITGVGGQILQGSSVNTANNMTIAEVLSLAQKEAENINATGSMDASLAAMLGQGSSVVSLAGGKLVAGSTIDVSSMTPDQIASLGQDQLSRLNAVIDHDQTVASASSLAGVDITKASGVMKPGSMIDASNLTPETIASMQAQQSAMLSVTAQADWDVSETVNSVSPVITKHGGTVTLDGTINTADNMTVEQVLSTVASQQENLKDTADADAVINSAIEANGSGISQASGEMKSGKAIDVSSMDTKTIASIASHQAAMVSATGSADSRVMSDVSEASSDITKNGGSISLGGTINTADNMTISDIESTVVSQESNINGTRQADIAINSAIEANSGTVESASGVLKPGSVMDVSSMNSEQIKSIMDHQVEMISATGSADSAVVSGVNSAKPDITKNGGTISLSGTINTADNMTASAVASTVASQLNNISQVASADRDINSAIEANSGMIKSASGVYVPGSAVDVSSMTSEQIASMTSKQVEMISATGSADSRVMSNVSDAEPVITKNGGTISLDGTINTADNMTVSDVESTVVSQETNIQNTKDADAVINSVIESNSGMITSASGVYKPGSVINVSSMTTEQISSIASQQAAMISATGSADSHVLSDVNSATSAITKNGGTITLSGTINTADNMTVSDVESTVVSQSVQISQVASADMVINDAIESNSSKIDNASGVYKPGKAIDVSSMTSEQVASITTQQVAMVNATGSADDRIVSDVDSASPIITKNGGTITLSGNINTADNMTVSDVESTVVSQEANINETTSADALINSAIEANSGVVSNASGVLKPGKAIDVSSMTIDEIKLIGSHQAAMIAATGSADSMVMSGVKSATPDIVQNGGSISLDGTINTADNMTVSDVISNAQLQNARLSQVASADVAIHSAVVDNSDAISQASGKETAGSAIDVTSMTSEEVASITSHQVAMVNATGSADSRVMGDVVAATSDITKNGGTISLAGTINTADNMTVSDVESTVVSQEANINGTKEADASINAAIERNSGVVNSASGVLKPGSAMDVSSMTTYEIASIAKHQTEMIDATGSADSQIMSVVQSAQGSIEVNGGTINQRGTVNTADNMTVSAVLSHVASQNSNVSQTASADVIIHSAVVDNSDAISQADGKETAGSDIDVTSMTSEEIDSITSHQVAMVNATGKADSDLTSAVSGAKPAIEANGGTIKRTGTINTADNMTESQVQSTAASQVANVNATKDADVVINSAIEANSGKITDASGVYKPGSAIDVSSMTVEQVNSIASHQAAMVSATGSADSAIMSDVKSASPLINENGGTVKQNGTVNTADNMTVDEINSHVVSQNANLSQTASADVAINSAVVANSGVISVASGVEKAGSAIDVTSMTSEEVASITSHQVAMVNATGSADSQITSDVNDASSAIEANGGTITLSGDINTADNMTVSDVASTVASQEVNIKTTKDADIAINSAIEANSGLITGNSGTYTAGSAITVTNMSPEEIKSIMDHQVAMVNATGSADALVKTDVDNAKSPINNAGGFINHNGDVNTADNMTVDQVASHAAHQDSMIRTTADGDIVIKKAQDSADGLSKSFGGGVTTGSAIDVSSMTETEITSLANSQVSKLGQVGSNNVMLSNTEARVASQVAALGGHISKGSVVDVTSMSPESLASLVNSQNATLSATGEGDVQISNAIASQTQNITKIGGKISRGDDINVASMTADQILSLAKHQVENLHQTGQGDVVLSHAVANVESKTVTRGNGIDVSSMTSQQIANLAASQADRLGETQAANDQLSTAIKHDLEHITRVGGDVKRNGVFDTTNLTSEQIASAAASQAGKANETATADDLISDAIKNNTPAITQHGGYVTSTDAIDTTNMTSGEIISAAKSQTEHITAVGSADTVIDSAVNSNTEAIEFVGGYIHNSGVNDATSMTSENMNSYAQSLSAHIWHTGNGDRLIANSSNANTDAIKNAGAWIVSDATTDVTGYDDGKIDSLAASEASRIQHVGDGDRKIMASVNSNIADVQHAGGNITSIATTDVTGRIDAEIDSLANSEASRIRHVGDGDRLVMASVSANYNDAITMFDDHKDHRSVIDATGMSDGDIDSLAHSEASRIQHTGDGTRTIKQHANDKKSIIENAGGFLTSSAVIDVTSMRDDEIMSLANSQASRIDHVADNDVKISNAVNNNVDAIKQAGGSINRQDAVDATSWTDGDIDNHGTSVTNHIQATGDGDRMITSAVNAAQGNLNLTNGTANNQGTIDVTNMSDDEIRSLASSQASFLSGAASANATISQMIDDVVKAGASYAGAVQVSANNSQEIQSIIDADRYMLTSAQNVAAASQSVRAFIDSANKRMSEVASVYTSTMNQNGAQGMVKYRHNPPFKNVSGDVITSVVNSQISEQTGSLNAAISQMIETTSAGAKVSLVTGLQNAAVSTASQTSGLTINVDSNNPIVLRTASDVQSAYEKQSAALAAAVAAQSQNNVDHSNNVSEVNSYNKAIADSYAVASSEADAFNKSQQDSYNAAIARSNSINDDSNEKKVFDSLVAEAKNTPGLNLVEDATSTADNIDVSSQGDVDNAKKSVIANYKQQAEALSNAIATQKQKNDQYAADMSTYNQQMQNLAQDQIKHDSGTFTWSVPGHPLSQYYAKVNWSADITWHWDVAQKAVIVTKVNVTFDRVNPNYAGGGFWDAFVFMNPNTNVPQEAGTYLRKQGDIPGINGDSLWQKIGGGGNSGIFAFYTQKNSTHEYTIKYDFNNSVPFKAVDNHDGTWTVLKSVIRQNDGGVGSGANALFHILWHNNDTRVTVNPNVPTIPTLKTTEAHYHYNTLKGNTPANPETHTAKPGTPRTPDPVQTTTVTLKSYRCYHDDWLELPSFSSDIQTPTYNPQSVSPNYKSLSTNYSALGTSATTGLATSYKTMSTKYTTESTKYTTESTNFAPMATNYNPYSTTVADHFNYRYSPLDTKYNVLNDESHDGYGYSPETMSTSPLGINYQSYSINGKDIPPVIPDPNHPGEYIPNPKFTGYTPISTTYKNYSTDGSVVNVYNKDGSLNKGFTGYTPISTTYKNYSTDGTNIPPVIPDPDHPGGYIPNPKFTGYTPISTTYKNYSTDGDAIKDTNPSIISDGNGGYKINPTYTGYTPISTTYKNYNSDGTNIPPVIPDPDHPGEYIPNPKFTGYTPISTMYKNYSTDGEAIKDTNPSIISDGNGGYKINPTYTGYTPISTTYKTYSSDGSDIPPMIPDPKNPGQYIPNPKFTGYTPISTTYKNYSTDGTNIPPMIPDPKNPGEYIPNPKFTGYTPISTTYKNYSTDGTDIPPVIPDPKNPGEYIPNPKFTGYTPISTTYKNYSTDGSKIPPMIPDPDHPGHYIPNPKFTGYTPISTTYKNYSTDGSKIPPMIPDPDHPGHYIPNPKFTGYTPISTTYKNYSTDGTNIPPVIPDPKNPGQYIPNPKFTGYAPMGMTYNAYSTMYTPLDSDGSKIPPMIPDPDHPGHYIPNPKFTGYAPFSTSYHPYSNDGRGLNPHDGGFSGFAPFGTKYQPMSTEYHYYDLTEEPAKHVEKPSISLPSPTPVVTVASTVPTTPLQLSQQPQPVQIVESPTPVTSTVAPNVAQAVLPQTGNRSPLLVSLAGLSMLGLSLGLTVLSRKKQ